MLTLAPRDPPAEGRDRGVLGSECVADDGVDVPVCIEVGGVDVIDPEVDGLPEEPAGSVRVAVESLELHGAVPDPGHVSSGVLPRAAGTGRAGGVEVGHSSVFLVNMRREVICQSDGGVVKERIVSIAGPAPSMGKAVRRLIRQVPSRRCSSHRFATTR